MMIITLSSSLALTACASQSYGLDYGDANYDALKAATETCKVKGGVIQLKSGYDGRRLENYVCKIGKAG